MLSVSQAGGDFFCCSGLVACAVRPELIQRGSASQKVVDLEGFEPSTSPVPHRSALPTKLRPSLSNEVVEQGPTFLRLQPPFMLAGPLPVGVFLSVHQFPRPHVLRRLHLPLVMLLKSTLHRVGLPDVVTPVPLALDNVHVKQWRPGGPGGIRTLDLLNAIEARSQLRHRPRTTPELSTPTYADYTIAQAAGKPTTLRQRCRGSARGAGGAGASRWPAGRREPPAGRWRRRRACQPAASRWAGRWR